MEKHFGVWRKLFVVRQGVGQALFVFGQHVAAYVGIVGAVEDMVGRGDREHDFYDFGRGAACQIVVEAREVGFPINGLHQAFGVHGRINGFHARHGKRQVRTAMRHDDFHVGITGKHVPRNHIHDGARGFCRIFAHRQRRVLHQFGFIGCGAVRVNDNDGMALVEHFHQCVQRLVAKILPATVGGELYSVGVERVERIDGFPDGGSDIGQR